MASLEIERCEEILLAEGELVESDQIVRTVSLERDAANGGEAIAGEPERLRIVLEEPDPEFDRAAAAANGASPLISVVGYE